MAKKIMCLVVLTRMAECDRQTDRQTENCQELTMHTINTTIHTGYFITSDTRCSRTRKLLGITTSTPEFPMPSPE